MYQKIASLREKKGFIISLLFASDFISILDRMVMTLAIALIGKEFLLNEAAQGWIMSIFFVGYALMSVPGGWLADKFGSKVVIISSITIWSVFTILTGNAWSWTSILVIRFLFGLGEGGFPAASMKAVSEYVRRENRPRMQAILKANGPITITLTPLITAPLMYLLGWRTMFVVIGILGIVIAALYLLVPRPEQLLSTTQEQSTKMPFREVIRLPKVWHFTIAWFGLNGAMWGFASWLPTYLMKSRGLDLLHAGIYSAMPGLAGALGTVVGGILIDKLFVNREKYLFLIAGVLGGSFLYAMFFSTSLLMILLYEGIAAFFLQMCIGGLWSIPHKMFPASSIGSVSGIMNFGGQIAAILAPVTMGYLITMYQGTFTGAVWYLMGALIIFILAALGIRFQETNGKHTNDSLNYTSN
ncbi:Predicted arabinose efflux permease, MFS family [Seinonella peptonophila]|uniref:Predicted arabinose efflux permease, MFS family n=1 Tax=Seinonella peptonophila TaxID=112248 RepID=A0A1M5ADU7_9BACL|nr:MFS transporter [Seinonella peptonophila]SHF28403.1 Predicted arabinose efflux permease, MFS family [Seinonella peptonophila]